MNNIYHSSYIAKSKVYFHNYDHAVNSLESSLTRCMIIPCWFSPFEVSEVSAIVVHEAYEGPC